MKRKAFILCLCGFIILVLWCGSRYVYGERISERIQLNGFISQGFIYSTHNDFIPQSSVDGSFQFSEIGLIFSVDVVEKLRIGCQFLARDFGPIGNYNVTLDWGFADYRFSNAFGIRVGKIKAPLGFYNEIRDTDTLFPMAVLPQSIYDESYRSVLLAYTGIGFHGDLDIGIGSLSYNLFTGGADHASDAPYLTQIRTAINRGLAQTGMSISPLQMETQAFLGGRLQWKTPIRGLRLGGTYAYLRARYEGDLTIPSGGTATTSGRARIKNYFVLSGEWAIGNFTLSSEYMELPVELYLELFGDELQLTDETQQGWYILGSYVFADRLTLYIYYDQFYQAKGDSEGNTAVRLGLPNFFGWQKDIVMGARYDISFNWTVKAEWHILDGVAKSAVFFSDIQNPRRKWNMLAVKISYNF